MSPRQLNELFSPTSVCIIGASDDAKKVSGKPLDYLTRHKFSGRISVVNPYRETVQGHRSFSSISDIEGPIDVAIVVVPAPDVPGVVRECEEFGVRNVVILTSGFDEAQNGATAAAELREIRTRRNINIVGPNCEGLWNLESQTVLTLGSIANRPELLSGPVAVISQSGSIGAGLVRNLHDLGIGCNYFVSTGNEVDLGALDFLEYFSLLPEPPNVILLFLEGLRHADNFVRVSRNARQNGCVIVALKSGRTEAGKIATASHTGKIASESAVYSDIFRQGGVIEVGSIVDLVKATQAILGCKPFVSGAPSGGVGVLGLSGGSRALIVDAAEDLGVPLARFSQGTRDTIASIIPSYGVSENPTDITAQVLSSPEMFERVLTTIAEDSSTEAVLVQFSNSGARDLPAMSTILESVREATQRPMVASMLGDEFGKDVRSDLFGRGILFASGPDEAVKALHWAYAATGNVDDGDTDSHIQISESVENPGDWERFIAESGVQVPKSAILGWDDAPVVPPALTLPLVAKALPAAIAHKAEIGAVRINLETPEDFASAVSELRSLKLPGEGLLIQEMIPDGLELLVSLHSDPDFGPILTVGAGGFFVELLEDVCHVSLPCTQSDIERAMSRLRISRAFRGYRTNGMVDVSSLAATLCHLGSRWVQLSERPTMLEINPLIALDDGRGVFAVDVTVEFP